MLENKSGNKRERGIYKKLMPSIKRTSSVTSSLSNKLINFKFRLTALGLHNSVSSNSEVSRFNIVLLVIDASVAAAGAALHLSH